MRFLLLGSGIVWVDCVMPEHGRGSGCGALMVVSGGGRVGVEIGVGNNVCSGKGGFIVMVPGTLRVSSCLWSVSVSSGMRSFLLVRNELFSGIGAQGSCAGSVAMFSSSVSSSVDKLGMSLVWK